MPSPLHPHPLPAPSHPGPPTPTHSPRRHTPTPHPLNHAPRPRHRPAPRRPPPPGLARAYSRPAVRLCPLTPPLRRGRRRPGRVHGARVRAGPPPGGDACSEGVRGKRWRGGEEEKAASIGARAERGARSLAKPGSRPASPHLAPGAWRLRDGASKGVVSQHISTGACPLNALPKREELFFKTRRWACALPAPLSRPAFPPCIAVAPGLHGWGK